MLESFISITDIVKKDGRMSLEPKFREPDSFLTRIKGSRPFNFCVKLAELLKSTLSIKLELQSIEEVTMQIKHSSSLNKDDLPEIKHLEIPFTVCMSPFNEKPNPFTDEMHRFDDSNTITYKVPKHTPDKFLYLQLKAEQDCILKATASAVPQYSSRKRTNSMNARMYASDASLNTSSNSMAEARNLSLEPS